MDIYLNIKQLAGIQPEGKKYVAGKEMSELNAIDNAWLTTENGRIIDFGNMQEKPSTEGRANEIDLTGRIVLPAFCDSHTHIVYAGSRENEFRDKINGLTYEEIYKRGGGILNSAKLLHSASEEELYRQADKRLKEVEGYGTGAIEIKSGYGLNTADELKILRVIKSLKENSKLIIKSTFLGAHAFPLDYRDNHNGYTDLIISEMLPAVAKEGLADYIDVFCDKGFFNVEQTERILRAAKEYGIKPKIHANELDISGGVQVGIANKALSVDHLESISEVEIKALSDNLRLNNRDFTMPTLLPGSAFYLGLKYPPARQMIDAGLAVAIASDYNPGSSPSGNMQLVLSLACIKLKMTPEEAINACTINSAYAMGISDEVGSITKNKKANLLITKAIPSISFIPYAYGSNNVERVIL